MSGRFKHNLSCYRLTTCDMGQLVPVGLFEVLPGDTFRHSANALIRLSPLAAPVMHSISVRLHHFFVPHRLVWPKDHPSAGSPVSFEEFITGGEDGNDSTAIPTLTNTAAIGDILDHYGVPRVTPYTISSLPARGYNLIFNEYYRDADLVSKRTEEQVDTARIAWEKDYFTSARPWPQKGADVTLPLGDRAPVKGIGKVDGSFISGPVPVRESDGTTRTYGAAALVGESQGDRQFQVEQSSTSGFPNIYADLANATAANVNEIRLAFALQRFQEARARWGSRYTEYLRYLGVTPSDARLDRPEYLGGGRVRVAVSEVLQTGPETGQQPTKAFGVADMYGHGIAAMRSNAYQRFFEEHGYVHTLMSIRPKAIYNNSLERHWIRRYREDFFQRELQHIGQQEVYHGEVCPQAGGPSYTSIFGYQDRYMEYRSSPSLIASQFRDKLNYWHQARIFSTCPELNSAFVTCTPSKRIHNEQTEDSLWCMVQHACVARRMVSRNASARIL